MPERVRASRERSRPMRRGLDGVRRALGDPVLFVRTVLGAAAGIGQQRSSLEMRGPRVGNVCRRIEQGAAVLSKSQVPRSSMVVSGMPQTTGTTIPRAFPTRRTCSERRRRSQPQMLGLPDAPWRRHRSNGVVLRNGPDRERAALARPDGRSLHERRGPGRPRVPDAGPAAKSGILRRSRLDEPRAEQRPATVTDSCPGSEHSTTGPCLRRVRTAGSTATEQSLPPERPWRGTWFAPAPANGSSMVSSRTRERPVQPIRQAIACDGRLSNAAIWSTARSIGSAWSSQAWPKAGRRERQSIGFQGSSRNASCIRGRNDSVSGTCPVSDPPDRRRRIAHRADLRARLRSVAGTPEGHGA